MNRVTRAIRRYCMTSCTRPRCVGCAFKEYSARKQQLQLFAIRRARADEVRGGKAGAAR
jgi:hypothetical protein